MVDRQQDEASARVGGRSGRHTCSLGGPQPGYAKLPIRAPPGCPSPQREWKERREGVCDGHGVVDSEGSDVIECVVQLFTDGLVLHLLCVDFIWEARRGGGKGAWGEEVEEGRRRGWREDDEMETRTRGWTEERG